MLPHVNTTFRVSIDKSKKEKKTGREERKHRKTKGIGLER